MVSCVSPRRRFDAAYPFGQVHLPTADCWVKVTVKGFNPMDPAMLRPWSAGSRSSYEVTNETPHGGFSLRIAAQLHRERREQISHRLEGTTFGLERVRIRTVFAKLRRSAVPIFYSDSVDHNDPALGQWWHWWRSGCWRHPPHVVHAGRLEQRHATF